MFSGLTIWYWTADWCAFPWRKTTSPAPSFPQLPAVLYVGPRPHVLFSAHFGIILVHLWAAKLVRLYGQNFWPTRTPTLTGNLLMLWLLQSFHPLFLSLPWAWGGECFIEVSTGIELYTSAYWLIVVFCSGLCMMQWEVSWWDVRTALTCGYKNRCLQLVVRDDAGLVN